MPVKKSYGAPTRKSKRIASREPSVASSDNDIGLSLQISSAPAPASLPVVDAVPTVKKTIPKKNSKPAAPAWDVMLALRRIVYLGDTRYIHELTHDQRAAVTEVATQQNREFQRRIKELEQEVTEAHEEIHERDQAIEKARNTSSIRRTFTMKNIQQNYEEKLRREQEQEAQAAQAAALIAPSSPPPQPMTHAIASPPQTTPQEGTNASVNQPQQQSSLRKMLGFVTSRFVRKYSAQETESALSRTHSHVEDAQGTPQATHQLGPIRDRKRAAEDDDDVEAIPSQKRQRIEDAQSTPQTTTQLGPIRDRKRPVEDDDDAEATPSQKRMRTEDAQRTPQSTQKRQSPRDYAGPSSKNNRMPTSLSTITEYTEPSMMSNAPDSTPSRPSRIPEEPPSTLKIPQHTLQVPRQNTPFQLRRAAALRAARNANTPTTQRQWAWEKQSMPKPKEPNADARLAKLERMRVLQMELEELKRDEDIKEMEAHSVHRRKRVKVDDLVSIPHNRPGDSQSTFRVPDVDSDDEMEVDSEVQERSNVFEELEDNSEEEVEDHVQQKYEFPDVGRVPHGYHVSTEFKEAAGHMFTAGLAEFLAAS